MATGWERIDTSIGTRLEFVEGVEVIGEIIGFVHVPEGPKVEKAFDVIKLKKNETGEIVQFGVSAGLRALHDPQYLGRIVRIRCIGEVDTGKPSAMKNFEVDVQAKA